MTEYSDKKGLSVNTKKFYRVVAINSMHPAAPMQLLLVHPRQI